MSKQYVKRHVLEKNKNNSKEKEKPNKNIFSKNFKKIYPIGLHRTCSPLSLSLSLSQNSTDSSLTDYSAPLDEKISLAIRLIAPTEKREVPVAKIVQQPSADPGEEGLIRRCNWITKNSGKPISLVQSSTPNTTWWFFFVDKVYVQFHDECWGVPVYDDNELFELLALSGMLMDFNWTEILKRRQLLREAFAGFEPNQVAKMGEKEIMDMATNKELNITESRVRCIADNAKCITKIAREYGSFSSYIWEYVNYKPMINKFRHPRNVPLRNPKAEAISKDLLRRGFRFVGPVIVYSFMQAIGMTIDHLVDCFRYRDCVNLAERPWRHV